jgi:hypothetical protein
MWLMPWWKRGSWRWVGAVAAICLLLLLVGVEWRSAGLGPAANLAQVLSLSTLVTSVAAWGWRARHTSWKRIVTRPVELAALLRDLAEAHASSADEIYEALNGWDVGAYLSGAKQPEWEFVEAFLKTITKEDAAISEVLGRLVRPVWEAARDQELYGTAKEPVVLVQVTARAGVLLTTSQQAAEATRAAGHLQKSAVDLESFRERLGDVLGAYASAIKVLAAERDDLSAQLERTGQGKSRGPTEHSAVADELDQVRESLAVTKRLHEEGIQRLAKAERDLRRARKLRDEALAQLTRSRRSLDKLEHGLVRGPSSAGRQPAAIESGQQSGIPEHQAADEFLPRADAFLRQQDVNLGRHGRTILRLRRAMGRPGYPSPRTAATIAAGAIVAIAASFGVLALTPSRAGIPPYSTLPDHGTSFDSIDAVTFSPDGLTLAVGDSDGRAYLWNPATAEAAAALSTPGNHPIDALAFNPHGTILAIGTRPDDSGGPGVTYLLQPNTGIVTATLTDMGNDGSADALAFSPDGSTLAVGDGDGSTYLWSTATEKLTATLIDRGGNGVRGVAFSPDGSALAVGDGDGSTYLWNIATRKLTATLTDPEGDSGNGAYEAATFSGVSEVTFSPDGSALAAGDGDGSTYLWNTATGKITATLTAPGDSPVTAVAFGSNGSTIAVGDDDGRADSWNVATDKIITTFAEPEGNSVSALAFSPNRAMLAAGAKEPANSVGGDSDSTYLWHTPKAPKESG